MADRPWTDADRELAGEAIAAHLDRLGLTSVASVVRPYAVAAAVLDALTAAGWRPPPPKPDGIHWRTGTSAGRTVYNPYGDLAGLMHTPEQARVVVAALNAAAERGDDA